MHIYSEVAIAFNRTLKEVCIELQFKLRRFLMIESVQDTNIQGTNIWKGATEWRIIQNDPEKQKL